MASQAAVPPAQKNFTVVVPMAVQALVVAQDFASTAAQFAPLIEPDYATILQHAQAGAPTHDLMDDLDLSYWRMQARYSTRFIDPSTGQLRSDRCGVYLSWCLPRLYRAAITATDSATDATAGLRGDGKQQWDSRKARAGFKCSDVSGTQAANDKSVQFRPAPDRWIVIRQVRGKPSLTKYVLVESNCIRRLHHLDIAEDFESATCPAMDPSRPMEDQPLLRMGRARPLAQMNTMTEGREYRAPFNSFELGHEYFADYAPHNMGVFSYFDNLEGIDAEVVDYSVIGFHSSAKDSDPLTFVDSHRLIPDGPRACESGEVESELLSNKELLDALHLKLSQDTPAATNFERASASIAGRTLTQGILRNVRWSRMDSRGMRWPAALLQGDVYAEQPISVGVHMLDALETYLHFAMSGNQAAQATAQSALSQLVMRIMAEKDDPDSLRKAAEEAALQSFLARPQGIAWVLPKDDKNKTETISKDAAKDLVPKLKILNQGQATLDTCAREAEQLMQNLYACWWNAASLRKVPLEEQQPARDKIRTEARKVVARLRELAGYIEINQTVVDSAREGLEKLIGNKKLEAIPTNPFGQHQDPTVLMAGAKSGWPDKFNETLPVRLASQISPDASSVVAPDEGWLETEFKDISRPVVSLLRELEAPSPKGVLNPYESVEDMNNTQGWFPLFLEWELEYYHVPFNKWEFENDKDTGRWRYVIPTDGQLLLHMDDAVGEDMRIISGRSSFLPETGKSLGTRIEQLLSQSAQSEQDKKSLKETLQEATRLEYFAADLSGLAEHLTTRRRGHHPRPKAGDGSGIEKVLGIDPQDLQQLEINGPSNLAPYGISTPLDPSYTDKFSPFKPVTHGQARFTKFAIVDKFGQVVSGIRLGPNGDGAMYPCISPSLACGTIPAVQKKESEYWPNTVVEAEREHGRCQFFQIPPRINQPAGLNAHFLEPLSDAQFRSSGTPVRNIASEWDNPIWAWVLPNFHNHSVQVYGPSGDFVIEMIIITEKETVTASDGPSDEIKHPAASGRLRVLVDAIRDYKLCSSLFDMLTGASDSVLATGTSFDSALPAALGRPFCIADVGVSIELSSPPLEDASLLSSASPELMLGNYEFPVALGNHTAAFDGLVGTFPTSGDIDKIASAYTHDSGQLTGSSPSIVKKRRPMSEHPQPLRLKPYFLPGTLGGDLDAEHRKRLSVVSTIIDPKTPMHIYSGSLFPVASLPLPRWPVDEALRKLRAFFAVGPILVPAKPEHNEARIMVLDPNGENLGPTIQMPLGGGEGANAWQWLQPSKESIGNRETKWSKVAIMPLDEKLKTDAADQSQLVEGYIVVKSG
ncbi:uncharacterized protein NECHADRAFT_78007 [Fusarium vanettenii 77-13-4]|uniref:Uncharacterized protein n=1 Tax=Fusarium vanettenii (strain ATCC MYA-4622 / CBS 123669 / FGSC 9596 / NRRL 45880 / 77-13-4) TaxID=660122 RepID=C7YMV1_FUSV7|nr:uncharacterized protein NECHADRAFT_78007 [Fusarium vanettenii 77-13-4]EEU47014.1 predicted protein [Fusarium vanettenii 77-13-4]